MASLMALGLFAAIGLALMAGFPVAFTLAGVALMFAGLGVIDRHVRPGIPGGVSQPHFRHHDQRNPDRGAGVRVHGGHAGAFKAG